MSSPGWGLCIHLEASKSLLHLRYIKWLRQLFYRNVLEHPPGPNSYSYLFFHCITAEVDSSGGDGNVLIPRQCGGGGECVLGGA